MKLRFTKMTGLGNDFVMLDGISQRLQLTPERVRRIADRHFGVGCDQVLVVEPPERPEADFRYRIYNADGGEVENCGNGARCFAIFVRQRRLSGKRLIKVDTKAGPIELKVIDNQQVEVDMGPPRFEPADIPFTAAQRAASYELELSDGALEISAVSMGNPHAVTRVEDVHNFPVAIIGPQVERHARFPERVNAGFVQVVDRGHLKLRVYERGAGETLACGTGACAAAVTAITRGWTDTQVKVELPGGPLIISWAGGDSHVRMLGPATTVFHGQMTL